MFRLDAIDSLGNHSTLISHARLATTFSGLFLSASLGHIVPREELDLDKLAESGERCDEESYPSHSPSGNRRTRRVITLRSPPSRASLGLV